MSYSKQVLRELYDPNRPEPKFTYGPMGFDTGMPGAGRNIGGGGAGGGLPGFGRLVGGTVGLIGTGIGALRDYIRRPGFGGSGIGGGTGGGDTGGGGGTGGDKPGGNFISRQLGNLIRGVMVGIGAVGGAIGGTIVGAQYIWGKTEETIHSFIDLLPLKPEHKEWLKANTMVVVVGIAAVAGTAEAARRATPRIMKVLRNRRIASEISDALDAGDETMARTILLDAIEDENINLSAIRRKLGDEDFERLYKDYL